MKIRLASKISRKIILISLVVIIQGFSLYAYYNNQDFISFFRFSYLTDIYIPIYAQKINGPSKYFASVAQFNNTQGNTEPQIRQKNATSIPVLLYHGVVDNWDDANILLEDFRNQMFALKEAGWQTVSIEDFYKFMEGKKELPDKSFLLTFDDGRKDSYYPVDPILSSLNYKATIFIITDHAFGEASPFYLSKKELIKMVKGGRWDIQAHTKIGHDFYNIDAFGAKGHFYSNKLWLDNEKRLETEDEFRGRVREDFDGAKQDLQNKLGINSIAFAFPFGDFGQRTINFLDAQKLEEAVLKENESVYKLAFYQVAPGISSIYNYPTKTPYLIKRVNIRPEWTPDNLLKILDASKTKKLPYHDSFTDYNGWIKDWGRLSFSGNNSMIMGAYGLAKGNTVFLDGAYLWQNYIFKADVYLAKGQIFSLAARYKDGKNYTACSFSDKSIRVEQVLNGGKKVLSELKGDFAFISKNLEVGIGVYDNTVNCYLDGRIAITGFNLDQGLDSGGIGFKTWDPKVNNSEIIVQKVNVREISDGEANEFILAIKRELAKDKLSVLKKSLESARQILEDTSNKQKEGNRVDSNGKKSSLASANILWSLTDNAENSTPYHKIDFTGDLGWKKMWGEYFVKDRALRISSGNSNSSALVIQNNSVSWSDYFFKTRLDWLKGATFSLVARYQDSKNYMACVYSNYGDGVRLDQVIDGKTITLASNYGLSTPYFMPWADLNFGVKVRDNHIECFVNDQRIFNFNVDQMPKIGGIGFKVWDNTPIGGEVAVREINVEAIKN